MTPQEMFILVNSTETQRNIYALRDQGVAAEVAAEQLGLSIPHVRRVYAGKYSVYRRRPEYCISESEIQRIVKMYRSGWTMNSIATKFGRNVKTIRRVISVCKIHRPSKGSEVTKQGVIQGWRQGKGVGALSREFGVPARRVQTMVKDIDGGPAKRGVDDATAMWAVKVKDLHPKDLDEFADMIDSVRLHDQGWPIDGIAESTHRTTEVIEQWIKIHRLGGRIAKPVSNK